LNDESNNLSGYKIFYPVLQFCAVLCRLILAGIIPVIWFHPNAATAPIIIRLP